MQAKSEARHMARACLHFTWSVKACVAVAACLLLLLPDGGAATANANAKNNKRLLVPAETQLEVEQWFAAYADMVDHRKFDEYAVLFDPRARPDYTASGGRTGSVAEMRAWLESVFQFLGSQHMVTNIVVLSVSRDDSAVAGGGSSGRSSGGGEVWHTRAMLHNPMALRGLDAVFSPILTFGGWYFVDFVRDGEGNLVAASLRQEAFYNNAASSIGLLLLLAVALAGLLRAVLCGSNKKEKNKKNDPHKYA
jgi:hypothetical protein